MLDGFRRTAAGTTAAFKKQLASAVDDETQRDIVAAAVQMLKAVPPGVPIGTTAAALMLAATAFVEFGAEAARLVEQDAPQS